MRLGDRPGACDHGAMILALLLTACADPAPEAAPVQAAPQAEAPATAPPPAAAEPASEPVPVRLYGVRVVRTFPHDETAFTQGLFFADGALYESTGKRGASVIRRIDMRDGGAALEAKLPDDVFGEGATVVDDRILSLSWREGLGFVHDVETLSPEGTFEIEGEGWGLAYDEARDRLVLSDGTPNLRFLDPDTYAQTGSQTVTLNGRPLPRLNELEYVAADGTDEIWANVWQQDFIVRIDPDTGAVTGAIDVSGLYPAAERADPRDDVANGIAYEPRSDRLFLTGKRWPELFEVELVERTP